MTVNQFEPDEVFIPEHIKLVVKHGAAFLDEREPGWEQRLDLESLELQSHCHCVIGQLRGDFTEGAREMGLTHELNQEQTANAGDVVDLGFYCQSTDFAAGMSEFDQLTAAWRSLVSERLSS